MCISRYLNVGLRCLVSGLLVLSLAPAHAQTQAQAREFMLLSINDVYRVEGLDAGGRGGPARVRTLRRELERQFPDLLLLHAGDAFYPSLLSRRYRGEQMVDLLNGLDGAYGAKDPRMFVTFGNHEFDKGKCKDAVNVEKRLVESEFQWLSANVVFGAKQDGQAWIQAKNLAANSLIKSGGVTVGIFGLTANIASACYIQAYLDPVATAKAQTAALRKRGAEVVIALTHQSVEDDAALLQQLRVDGPDLIIGGHEHETQVRQVHGRWLLKADADAISAIVARVSIDKQGRITVHHQLRRLDASVAPDARLVERAESWNQRFDSEYCSEAGLAAGCLDEAVGFTQTPLQGEELFIRAHESALGDWIADQMRDSFAGQKAQVAIMNSGSLRLNQDIPARSVIKRRHIEELFAYPSTLKLIKIDGATLRQVVEHSARSVQQGAWLQIAGLAYRLDDNGVRDISVLAQDGMRALDDKAKYSVVSGDFLLDTSGNQDGYTMLKPEQIITSGDELKDLVYAKLKAAGEAGIAPRIEGRICEADSPTCLAVANK